MFKMAAGTDHFFGLVNDALTDSQVEKGSV